MWVIEKWVREASFRFFCCSCSVNEKTILIVFLRYISIYPDLSLLLFWPDQITSNYSNRERNTYDRRPMTMTRYTKRDRTTERGSTFSVLLLSQSWQTRMTKKNCYISFYSFFLLCFLRDNHNFRQCVCLQYTRSRQTTSRYNEILVSKNRIVNDVVIECYIQVGRWGSKENFDRWKF